MQIKNLDGDHSFTAEIKDNSYKKAGLKKIVGKAGSGKERVNVLFDLSNSYGWYDFTIRIAGVETFEKRYAGHVETGASSQTDPAMGNLL